MKRSAIGWAAAAFLFLTAAAGTAAGQDIRLSVQQREKQQQALVEKAASEERAAREAAKAQRDKITRDKALLQAAIAALNTKIRDLTAANEGLAADLAGLKATERQLQDDLAETRTANREFQGYVRANAKDLAALLVQSPSSALAPGREAFLAPITQAERLPTMDDVNQMADLLFSQVKTAGEVTRTRGIIVDREGREREADILMVGHFTGIYDLDGETGFLLYSDKSQRYFALSRLPSDGVQKKLNQYLDGGREDVAMDISQGEALRRLARELSLTAQIPKGGAIVWPILAILGIAALIVSERIIFFARRGTDTERLMDGVKEKIAAGDFQGCRKLLEVKKTCFVPRVLLRALALRDPSRTDMENALQETILGEIPAIERFISTLGMLAAIAPLLGLLGTVTGMINTFHVITSYGTGDPRMMSGGISEALVTTMLGLSVAIPVMLAHTLLSRKVELTISKMEEKAVTFVNLVFEHRNGGSGA